jgi:hypothetical protein
MDNTPKKTRENISFNFDWTYGVELSKFKKDIEELEKLGVTHLDIQVCESYGCASISIEAINESFETDLEVSKRVSDQEERVKRGKQNALEQIERLKKEYDL